MSTTVRFLGDQLESIVACLSFDTSIQVTTTTTSDYCLIWYASGDASQVLEKTIKAIQSINYSHIKRIVCLLPTRWVIAKKELHKVVQSVEELEKSIQDLSQKKEIRLAYLTDAVIEENIQTLSANKKNKPVQICPNASILLYPTSIDTCGAVLHRALFKPKVNNLNIAIIGDTQLDSTQYCKNIISRMVVKDTKIITLAPKNAESVLVNSPTIKKSIQQRSNKRNILKKKPKRKRKNKKNQPNKKIKKPKKTNKKISNVIKSLIKLTALLLVLVALVVLVVVGATQHLVTTSQKAVQECLGNNSCQSNTPTRTLTIMLDPMAKMISSSISLGESYPQIYEMKKTLSTAKTKVEANSQIMQLAQTATHITQSYIAGNQPQNSLLELKTQANKLSELAAQLENKRLLERLSQLQNSSRVLEAISSQENVRIAIVVQNSAELRPTGGFISVIGLIDTSQGRVVNQQWSDVYSLDDKLNGRVSPPEQLSRLLNESSWYLRDANWSPDTKETAAQISWFLDKQTSQRPGLVILINTRSLEGILEVIGEQNLDGKIINAQNLATTIASTDTLTASQAQKLPLEAEVVRNTIDQLINEPTPQLLLTLADQIKTGEISVVGSSEELASTTQLTGVDSGIPSKRHTCEAVTSDCQDTYMVINEANIGINQVNQYIDRNVTVENQINQDSFQSSTNVTISNKAKSNNWPLGTYKAYLRFLTHPNNQLVSLTSNGKEVSSKQLVLEQVGSHVSFGIPVEVPIQSMITLSIVTKTPITVVGESAKIRQHLIKQPGVKPYSVDMQSISQEMPMAMINVVGERLENPQQILNVPTYYDIVIP